MEDSKYFGVHPVPSKDRPSWLDGKIPEDSPASCPICSPSSVSSGSNAPWDAWISSLNQVNLNLHFFNSQKKYLFCESEAIFEFEWLQPVSQI